MDIAYVYYSAFDPRAAHANQLVHTCNALVALGHDVTVVCAGDIHAYARTHGLPVDFETVETPFGADRRAHDRVAYYLRALAATARADVVFTRDISFLRVLGALPAWSYPPVVYEAHKSYAGVGSLDADEERARLAVPDVTIAISHGVAADLRDLGVEVAAVVPDAADLSQVPDRSKAELREELGLDRDARVLVYAGSLAAGKNDLEGVIASVARLRERVEGVRFLVLGGDDEAIERLRGVRETAGLPAEAVSFKGYRPQSDVFRYLAAADVGVVPLVADDPRAAVYTSPLKLYEYLVCGLRVVASDVPAITAAVDDEPVTLHEPGDADALTDALAAALSAGDLPEVDRDRYSYRGRAAAIDAVLPDA